MKVVGRKERNEIRQWVSLRGSVLCDRGNLDLNSLYRVLMKLPSILVIVETRFIQIDRLISNQYAIIAKHYQEMTYMFTSR
jgi:hypothetical protein